LDGIEEPTSGAFWPINIQLINNGALEQQTEFYEHHEDKDNNETKNKQQQKRN